MMFCLLSYTLALPPYMIPGGSDVNPDMTKKKDPEADILHVEDIICSPLYSTPFWRYQSRLNSKCGSRGIVVSKKIMFIQFLNVRRM